MFDSLIEIAREWGAALLIVGLFMWGTIREWWVFGPQHKRVYDEMLYWRKKALEGVGLAEEAAKVALEVVS